MAEPVRVKIGAINTDWTNRSLTAPQLKDDILSRLRAERPAVLTLSEVAPKSLLEEITQPNNNYVGISEKIGYDQIVQVWNTDSYSWEGSVEYSKVGKYMAVPLEHGQLRETHLHVSVHLPHKRNKKQAAALLQSYLDECDARGDYNNILVHGDFNKGPRELKKHFRNFHLALDHQVTTRQGGKCDNIVSWEDWEFDGQIVQQTSPYTHHPIYASLLVEPD